MAFNPPLRDWRGKTVWLVGASSGIGEACANLLYEQGATVFVSARNSLVLNPGVIDVCVLEPETGWTVENMNERVAALHQRFEAFALFGPRTLAEMRSSMRGLGVSLSERDVQWLDLRTETR